MPNHVTNKLIFDAEHLQKVIEAFCPDGKFDFDKLIPSPSFVYKGDISSVDENDFGFNWYKWNRENWGTKWNCYAQKTGTVGDKAYVQFDTAWSVPYPVIVAFGNTLKIPFQLKYFDEGHNFWGIEDYTVVRDDYILRASRRFSDPGDEIALHIELLGYDPNAPDEEE